MIISHKYKCIAVHIPKSAGSSINRLFWELDPQSKENLNKIVQNPPYGHISAKEIRRIVGDEVYDSYFKFSFIRNPYSWFKSYYLYRLREGWPKGTEMYNKVGWLTEGHGHLPHPINGEIGIDHFMKCYAFGRYWLGQADGFQQVGWLNDDIDYIGLFENLDDEFEVIKNKIGLPSDVKIPFVNKALTKKVYLNSDVHQLISVLFKDDIQLYNKLTAIKSKN